MKKAMMALGILLAFSLPAAVHAQTGQVKGELTFIDGKPVLRVWGTHYEMGYAHGYLLAPEIVAMLEDYMLGRLLDRQNYWRTRNLLNWYTRIPQAYRQEMQGVYDGMVDALGKEALYSETIDDYFEPVDLLAFNMIPEIFRLYFSSQNFSAKPAELCSSISGWEEGTADGNLIFARNLDFGEPGDLLEASTLIIAYEHRESRTRQKSWVSIAWPGYLGCLTGMNENGIGAGLNLGNEQPSLNQLLFNLAGIYIGLPFYYTSTAFALRQVVENSPSLLFPDPIGAFRTTLGIINIAGSFDIHLFSPARGSGIGLYPPAAILECSNRGTALRTTAENRDDDPELLSNYYLAVTNHHRKLADPINCPRYNAMVEDLNATPVLDMERAFEIERNVAMDERPYNTVYMVGFIPDTLEMWLSTAEGGVPSYRAEPSRFTWEEIFGN
jgi:hypothetical protein